MSKTSKARRQAHKQKGARRLMERTARQEREFERLQRWLYQFPEIAGRDGARLETVLLGLASKLIGDNDPRAGEAIKLMQQWAPDSPETLVATAMLHLENRAYGSAWTCLSVVADSGHSLASKARDLMAMLESILQEQGLEPAQLLLWETAAGLIQQGKLSRARLVAQKLAEGWPEDQKAAELLAALPGLA